MTSDEVRSVNRSYEIAVRNLNSRAWEVMLPSEKVHDLQAIENKNAMDQNRIPCEVRAEPMQQGEWGYQVDNQIVVRYYLSRRFSCQGYSGSVFPRGAKSVYARAACRAQYACSGS